jgi:archaellum biogenesis ATPase FlaH
VRFPENLKQILRFARASRVHFEFDDLLTESDIRTAGNMERYAVDRLIPLNAISMVFSEEKGGKSLLTTYLLKCVANGSDVFGKYSTRKMRVVVLDLEASDADIDGYLSHFSRLGPEQIRYFTRKTGVPSLDSPALLRLCERERPLLLLESLTKFVSATGKDESMFDPADMSRFFDKVLNLCAAGGTVLITHHATRANAERYADSHQIGAAVARAYALVSLDRPRLARIRLETKLCRGAEPITENLVAFPLIAERGEFGLATMSGADPDLERVVEFVRSKGRVKREEIKAKGGAGIRASRAVDAITRALKMGFLIEDSERFLSIPNAGNAGSENSCSRNSGTAGTDETKNAENVL